jgi:hypothetical protein
VNRVANPVVVPDHVGGEVVLDERVTTAACHIAEGNPVDLDLVERTAEVLRHDGAFAA